MKIFIFILFTLLSVNVNAGIYTDLGFGYIQTLPGDVDTTLAVNGDIVVHLNEKANVEIASPFLMFRLGYEWNVINYLEYNRTGSLTSDKTSITTIRLYRRFESKLGFYTDLGFGYVIDIPEETISETERDEYNNIFHIVQTAIIDLNSPFPMARVGYRWKSSNIHIEFEKIGNIFEGNESILTLNIFKRWEFDR